MLRRYKVKMTDIVRNAGVDQNKEKAYTAIHGTEGKKRREE